MVKLPHKSIKCTVVSPLVGNGTQVYLVADYMYKPLKLDKMKIEAKNSDKPQKPLLNILAVSGRSEQLCPNCKVPMKPLYDKMACFKCMTHTP